MSCDVQNEIMMRSALEWIKANTTIPVDLDNPEVFATLPARAQLFTQKYIELMQRAPGVNSQSIEGLSMSFSGEGVGVSIQQLAHALLGGDMLSQLKAYQATRRW